MDWTVEIDRVRHIYPDGTLSLDGLSLTLEKGEKVAVTGHNGAGKTTLVKHINGLLKPHEGSVRTGGMLTAEHTASELSQVAGYLFQNPDDQIFCSTLCDEVAFSLKGKGLSKDEKRARIDEALSMTGLSGMEKKHPFDLSLPQRKMVALASVLVMDTPVVILDEPTAGQDGYGLERITKIINHLGEKGKTVVAISHDIDFCVAEFSRFIIMESGRIICDDTARNVFQQEKLLAGAGVRLPGITLLGKKTGIPQTVTQSGEFLKAMADLPRVRHHKGSYPVETACTTNHMERS